MARPRGQISNEIFRRTGEIIARCGYATFPEDKAGADVAVIYVASLSDISARHTHFPLI